MSLVSIIHESFVPHCLQTYEGAGSAKANLISTSEMVNPYLDFVQFLDSSSERRFPQLYEFLRKGKITPSVEIHYAGVRVSRESSSKNCTKSS